MGESDATKGAAMRRRSIAIIAGIALATTLFQSAPAAAQPVGRTPHKHRKVCQSVPSQVASCQSLVVTADDGTTPLATTGPTGYSPSDLTSAYGLPSSAGTTWTWNGRIIAIVDAFDNPSAEADLAAYRAQFGLPPCTVANNCFKKKPQAVGAPLPTSDVNWGQETDLDIEMASAFCPLCKIRLVEANSASSSDLGAAVNRAAALSASAISNSYSTPESFLSPFLEAPYNHPGIAITAATGDSGYGSAFPASSPHVIAVGGTTLTLDATTRARTSESAWSGGGSWCSDSFSQPAWQNGLVTSDPSGFVCGNRTVADVAAVADPNTGVSVYDSFGSTGGANWYQFGGTSVSTPLIAALFARTGDATHKYAYAYPAKWLYQHRGALFDVVSGTNGNATNNCYPNGTDPAYLCHAEPGYDGPTGLGTPAGLAGF